MEIGKIRSMLFHNKSWCKVSRSSNDIDFVLFPTAPSVGSPFTTIYINSTIHPIDATNIPLSGFMLPNLDYFISPCCGSTTHMLENFKMFRN